MTNYRLIVAPDKKESKQIIELYRQAAWWEAEDDEALVSAIVAGSHLFLLAIDEGIIVGMGRAISDRASDAYIQDVTVLQSHRHSGVGSRIIEIIAGRLREDGIKWIGLIAEKDSAPFYLSAGFAEMPGSTPMLLKTS